ncbi:MAG TPA: xanthine dehydrogenase family protein subunit M [Mycobacteriales bacterium]|nr:xanthine dehydrogenase family protein subunit M [Mycobacteriales bacterium]
MRPFHYEAALDTETAIQAAAQLNDAAFLAGGTNLVDLMKLGVAAPANLIDIGRLSLNDIAEDGAGGLVIGAGVRNSVLAADIRVRRRFPVLSEALLAGASGQLRNMATTGGNLLQRTRCRYFMDSTKPCNKRAPGTGCPAREGDHRNLAILGGSPACIATHPSDMAVALSALGALVVVEGRDGQRTVSLDDLYRLPGDDPTRDTTLEVGDLITAVRVPELVYAGRSTYRKARDRASYAFAVGSVAAALDVVDGAVREVRLAFGAVGPTPWRAHVAESALRGEPATAARFAAAADAELKAADPLRDNRYKLPLIRNLVVDVLSRLSEVTP